MGGRNRRVANLMRLDDENAAAVLVVPCVLGLGAV